MASGQGNLHPRLDVVAVGQKRNQLLCHRILNPPIVSSTHHCCMGLRIFVWINKSEISQAVVEMKGRSDSGWSHLPFSMCSALGSIAVFDPQPENTTPFFLQHDGRGYAWHLAGGKCWSFSVPRLVLYLGDSWSDLWCAWSIMFLAKFLVCAGICVEEFGLLPLQGIMWEHLGFLQLLRYFFRLLLQHDNPRSELWCCASIMRFAQCLVCTWLRV